MPFDPSKGNGGFSNYANPYAPKEPIPKSNKKRNIFIIVILICVLTLGFAYGTLMVKKLNSEKMSEEEGSGSQVEESKNVEIEIFDVEDSGSAD